MQSKCGVRSPPGAEIYRRDQLSVFEVRGDSAREYCTNVGLFARLFIRHESLYAAAVQQFTYYLLCSCDVTGCRLLGFFTKVTVVVDEPLCVCVSVL